MDACPKVAPAPARPPPPAAAAAAASASASTRTAAGGSASPAGVASPSRRRRRGRCGGGGVDAPARESGRGGQLGGVDLRAWPRPGRPRASSRSDKATRRARAPRPAAASRCQARVRQRWGGASPNERGGKLRFVSGRKARFAYPLTKRCARRGWRRTRAARSLREAGTHRLVIQPPGRRGRGRGPNERKTGCASRALLRT
jgi:hypothetical protein